jgi:hypothetical protein
MRVTAEFRPELSPSANRQEPDFDLIWRWACFSIPGLGFLARVLSRTIKIDV